MELIIIIFVVIVDQFSKMMIIKYLKPIGSLQIIKNFLKFTYVENRGAAFGILQNKSIFFIIVTIIVGTLLIYSMVKIPGSNLYKITLSLILGGAIGNLIDRIRLHYVVDFINFKYFPAVFNVADSFIVIGAIILVYLMLFNESRKGL